MQPFTQAEFALCEQYLNNSFPIDIFKMIDTLDKIQRLASTSTPVNYITVDQFRKELGAPLPHPDTVSGAATNRGAALLTAPDNPQAGDTTPTLAQFQTAWNNLVANNQGPYQSGQLKQQYSALWQAAGSPA